MLMILGYDVINNVDVCIHGREALEQIKTVYQAGNKYHLILTDFNMPIMDGIESTKQILAFLTQT